MFSALKFTFVSLWLCALLRHGLAQDVLNHSQTEKGHDDSISGSFQRTLTTIPAVTEVPAYSRHRRASSTESTSFCLTPRQPANGEYKLEKDFCLGHDNDCIIREGESLEPGNQLVYTCNSGYRAVGRTDVFCRSRGKWSPVPSCVEINCDSLNSASTTYVSCILLGKWINCDSSVPPETRAEVVCRPGYKRDTDLLSTRSGAVKCNIHGEWEPKPIKCVPACGQVITPQKPLAFGATVANIGDFPWHASIFVENNGPAGKSKDFLCGGTIIQTTLVLTAAHCVYDERLETTTDPSKLFVMTGNIFRDYDSPLYNPQIVRKAAVKTVYTYRNYYGLRGNYVSDIALLELQQPFKFSNILSPACLDDSDYSDQFLEHGVLGKVAGFGRTASSSSSFILQTLTLPYISYNQCKISNNAEKNQVFISSDKFCAGYNNGSAVCEGDSGGGLVFKKGDLWYVMGIVSVGLGIDVHTGEKTCDKYSFSLYTKVSNYIPWIRSVLLFLENKQPLLPYSTYTIPSIVATTKPTTATRTTNWWDDLTSGAPRVTSTRIPVFSCLAPPRPENGDRKLHPDFCEIGKDCNITEGTALGPGSRLVYSCVGEFTMNGATDVHCRPGGSWSVIPTCTGKLGDGRGAIARKKCREYANSMGSDTCPHSLTSNEESIYSSGKVLARDMEFPYMAQIGLNSTNSTDTWYCSGTLISESFVLAGTNCAQEYSNLITWVRVGEQHFLGSEAGAITEQRIVVEKILHPDHRASLSYNDIALLRLETPVRFNSWIRPACLHTSPIVETKEATETGWGQFDHNNEEESESVMKVVLPIVDSLTCNTSWPRSPVLPNGIIERQSICAGARGRDTCEGDWGSPLVIASRTQRCMYDVVGIVGFNQGGCNGSAPSVFTRVYHYLPWIEQVVWGKRLHNPR